MVVSPSLWKLIHDHESCHFRVLLQYGPRATMVALSWRLPWEEGRGNQRSNTFSFFCLTSYRDLQNLQDFRKRRVSSLPLLFTFSHAARSDQFGLQRFAHTTYFFHVLVSEDGGSAPPRACLADELATAESFGDDAHFAFAARVASANS